jgi:hypothetical protein
MVVAAAIMAALAAAARDEVAGVPPVAAACIAAVALTPSGAAQVAPALIGRRQLPRREGELRGERGARRHWCSVGDVVPPDKRLAHRLEVGVIERALEVGCSRRVVLQDAQVEKYWVPHTLLPGGGFLAETV